MFCGKDEESLEHLFIHCSKVWCMWTAIFSLSGGGWVCPFLVKDLLQGWLHLPMRKKDVKLWRAVSLCLLWAIWKERNRVVFDDETFSKSRLKSCFLFSLSSWASLMFDAEHFLLEIFSIFPSASIVGCFDFILVRFLWLVLFPSCIRPVYPLGFF